MPAPALSALKGVVQQLDPALPIYSTKTLTEHMGTSLFPARMAAIALGSFGVLALVLAAVGIYGVMSHVVAGRTREIGLRMALGAQLSDVRQLIVRQGMWLAAIGSLIGLALALTGARLLKSFLYGVSATDPITFTFIAVMLLHHRLPRLLDSGPPRQPRRPDDRAPGGVMCRRDPDKVEIRDGDS